MMGEILIVSISSYYLFAALATILTYYMVYKLLPSNQKLPPGPWGLPLLGNLLQMGNNPHLKLSQWAKSYGNLCTIKFATKKALLVSDPKLMKTILGAMASTGKFKSDTFLLISQGSYGIFNTDGNAWKEQRLFCIRSLKEFGFGSGRSMEPLILEGIRDVCEWIHETQRVTKSNVVKLDFVLKEATLKILWSIIFGQRVKLGESRIAKLIHTFGDAMQRTFKTGLGFFPWLKYLAPELSGYTTFDKVCRDIHAYIGGKFKEHTETYVEGERRDLIDAYIEQMRIAEKCGGNSYPTFQGEIGIKNSVSSISELFMGGGEITSLTCKWALHYLAVNQNTQDTLKKEIDNVIGSNRDPMLEDKQRMPYSEAVILETLRLSSIAPFGIFHEFLEDFHFEEYVFPKGMLLVPNMYHIHHNPDIWSDPEDFRPERFLSESGSDAGGLKQNLLPFQAGKRQCLGEHLAKDILFLFITKLIQQFQVDQDPSVSAEEYLKPDVGIGLFPGKFGLLMTSRKTN